MDWKLFITAFITLFLAELGDKTQLVIVAMSGSGKSPWIVFLGASLALTATTLVAVLVGAGLQKILPAKTIHIIAGSLFMLIGLLLIVKTLRT